MFVRWIIMSCLLASACLPVLGQDQIAKGQYDSGPRDGKASRTQAEGFGIGVAIDGTTAFVGESQGSLVEGLVVVFVRVQPSGLWTAVDTLFASPAAPGIRFGESLAVDGDWLFVGAPAANDNEGAVYVFEQQAPGVWTQHQILTASTPATSRGFASGDIAVSGDYAIVGAGANDAAYLYSRNIITNLWAEESKLVGNTPNLVRRFGWSVDIDSARAMVGAIRENSFEGGVYVFDRDLLGDWNQTAFFGVADGVSLDYFGNEVELRGDVALISSLGLGSRPAFVASFVRNGAGVWVEKDRTSGVGNELHAGATTLAVGVPHADSVHTLVFDSTLSLEDGFVAPSSSSGEQVGYSIGISGDYLIAGAPGNFTGVGHAYFFERQVDSTWSEVAAFAGTGTTFASITGGKVPCTAGFADIFPCSGIDLLSFIAIDDLPASGDIADIWGWHDDSTGREFAIITEEGGTNFVEVTDPENPVITGMLPIHAGSTPNAWHDVRVYQDHAYIVADAAGSAGVQIFDLTQLLSVPPGASLSKFAADTTIFSETAHYPGINSAHNISINEATGFAYVVGSNGGGTTCGGGLHMLDLSTPTAPSFAGCFADSTSGRAGTGYTHDVQCVVYHGPDSQHNGKEVCFGSNETHVVIADVTNKNAPTTIGKGTYPTARYIHQGWLTEDHRYFFQDDELDESGGTVAVTTTYIWDVQDLDDPVMIDTYSSGLEVVDHNQFVIGRYATQSDYTAGLRIVDFGDVESGSELMFFDTYPAGDPRVFGGAWGNYPYLPSGIILISSMNEGLFIVKPTVPLGLALDLTVLLEGPYAGSGAMSTAPLFDAARPASHPYVGAEFDGTSNEFDVPAAVPVMPGDAVDWVLVELRAGSADTAAVTTEPGILLESGRVVSPSGDTLRFHGALPGSYWVVVKHRNHAAVMSSSAVDLSSGSASWDFTDSAAKALGTNPMKSLGGGFFAMFAGDGSIDGIITAPDFNLWNASTTAGETGYVLSDYNLDGLVTAPDFNLWNANTTAGAASQVPD